MRKYATEAQEQQAIFEWAALMENKYPALKALHHIPNGGNRNKAEAASLKAQGVKAGVSDICLPEPRGPYHGLYIELKAHSGVPSPEQRRFVLDRVKAGYCAQFCWGADDAMELIEWYLQQGKSEFNN